MNGPRSRAKRHYPAARAGVFAVALGLGTAIASGLGDGIANADSGDSGSVASPGGSRTATAAGPVRSKTTANRAAAAAHPLRRLAASPAAAVARVAPVTPAPAAVRVVSAPVASVPVALARNPLASVSTAPGGGTPVAPVDAGLAVMAGAARRASQPAASATSSSSSSVDAEKMSVSGAGRSVSDRNAVGGYALALSGSGVASTTLSLPSAAALTVRVRTATGAPDMTLAIDGVRYTTVLVNNTSYTDYTFAGGIAAGTHVVSLASTTATTNNVLYIDSVNVSSGPIVEEFVGKSGAAPGSRWSTRTGTGFDSGVQAYSSSNAVLDGQGHLVISAVKNKSGGYTSGWAWSKNTMTFGYGTVTARIKMPKGQGLWPAVWMMGADSDTAGWPASGEIDIAELPSTTTTVYSTLHGPIAGTTDTQQAQIVSKLPDLSTDYHNYWVRHLPNEITFGVDNQTLGTLTPDSLGPGESWVYNRPMYLIMNLAVGGSWAGAPNSSTLFPAKMTIDSVRFNPA